MVFNSEFSEKENIENINDIEMHDQADGITIEALGGTLGDAMYIQGTAPSEQAVILPSDLEYASLDQNLAGFLNSLEPGSGSTIDVVYGSMDKFVPEAVEAIEELQEAAEEIADTQNIANELAGIEPAAGGAPTSASTGGSATGGYGFQSAFSADEITALNDIGAIDETQLEYDLPEVKEDLFIEQSQQSAGQNIPNIPNDTPTLITPDIFNLDESDLNLSKDGALDFDFGNDGAGRLSTTGDFSASGSVAGGVLSSGGYRISIHATDTGYEGVANGARVFTLTIDPVTGEYEYVQILPLDHADGTDANDMITLDFGVKVMDSDGDFVQSAITINVADDAPQAQDDVNNFDAPDRSVDGNVITGENGGVGAQDDLSNDQGNMITRIAFDGHEITVPQVGTVSIDGGFGTLEISADGSYTYTLFDTVGTGYTGYDPSIDDQFTYTLSDGDGDTSLAILSLHGITPTLIVGENVSDIDGEKTPHHIGDESGFIAGATGADVLIGDVGGSALEQQTQDYNFLFIVDVSGSMGSPNSASSKISLLTDAVNNLLNDMGQYQNGEIKVHFTPFSTTSDGGASFTITDAAGLNGAISYLNALSTGGYTNYEAAMQNGINWLQSGNAIQGAQTVTYFISDGEPNRYVTDTKTSVSGSANTVMGQISGSDGSDEISILNGLSDDVIGVGIKIGGAITRLDAIDSDGHALNINDPNDLASALADTNPLLKLASLGGDRIDGGDGDDIIFGDSINTDALAEAHNLNVEDGDGWDVMDRLENGESTLNPSWDRDDTIDYIRNNSDALAVESKDSQGQGRSGGDDIIHGGDGDDIIYGQEGNDIIYGGAGNDILSGGSGADVFVQNAIGQGVDIIRDFGIDEADVLDLSGLIQNYDPTQQAINDFIFTREVDGGTILSVDVSGSGDVSNAVDLVALEGLQNLDIQAMLEAGNIHVM